MLFKKIFSFFKKEKSFILTKSTEEPRPIPDHINQEYLILEIAGKLFEAALLKFFTFSSAGLIIDDNKINARYIIQASFITSANSEDPIFISIPINKEDNIEDELLQKSIYEKFVEKMNEAQKKLVIEETA